MVCINVLTVLWHRVWALRLRSFLIVCFSSALVGWGLKSLMMLDSVLFSF